MSLPLGCSTNRLEMSGILEGESEAGGGPDLKPVASEWKLGH